jgi:hypothetical protein
VNEAEIEALLGPAQQAAAPVQPVAANPQEVPPQQQQESAYRAPAQADPATDPEGWQREATQRSQQAGKEPGLKDGSFGMDPQAVVAGGLNAVFQTKDFMFGTTEEPDKSGFRQNVEGYVENAPAMDKVAAGFAQFGAGMLGAGKLLAAGKAIPWFGKLAPMGKGAKTVAETAKAAAVGAVAFDPYEERLSNMIQGTPLANPVTGFLAADKTDSRAVGRMKAAMESIGMDAAIIGSFTAGAQVYKFLKAGDAKGAEPWLKKLEKAQDQQIADQEGAELLDEIEVPAVEPVNPNVGTQGIAPSANDMARSPQDLTELQAKFDSSYAARERVSEEWERAGAADENYEAVVRAENAHVEDAMALRAAMLQNELPPGYRVEPYSWEANVKGGKDYKLQVFRESDNELMGVLSPVSRGGKPDGYFGDTAWLDDLKKPGNAPTVGDRISADIDEAMKDEPGYVKGSANRDIEQLNDMAFGTDSHVAQVKPDAPNSVDTTMGDLPQAANDGPPQVVDNATQAAAQQGVDLKGQPVGGLKLPTLEDFNADELLAKLKADEDAIDAAGSFEGAVAAGHKFAKSDQLPMQWLSEGSPERDLFLERSVKAVEERIQKQRGGKGTNDDGWSVLTDAELLRTVNQFARAYNESPDAILAALQQAAKTAKSAPAYFEVGIMLTNKLKLEASKLGSRIQLGDYTEFGSREAALLEFKRRTSLYQQTLGDTLAIRASGGRTVRRGQGALDRPDAALNDLDSEVLLDLWMKSEHDPATLRKIMDPSVMGQFADYAKYVLVNNLVSGPKTQIINVLTNGLMMGVRPIEKMIGASGQRMVSRDAAVAASANRQFREARKMYGYYAASLTDAWSQASKAFLKNDSVLLPHRTEAFRQNVLSSGGVTWKQMDSFPNLLWNAGMAAHVAIGLPTRGLGFVDELVKQTVYRAKLSSRAAVTATDEAMARGYKGSALKDYVRQQVDSALKAGFDEFGHGVDPEALREAQIATFQQELLTGTLGKSVQQAAANNFAVGLLLPFVKTPTNVIRYAWKLSPGLNLLQTEFRQSLKGQHGPEVQAEAIGQFTLGTLAVGMAAVGAIEGRITGGGPADPKMKAELMATGWQPYSYVRVSADGSKTYVPFGRLDPVGLPFGMVADIVDALSVAQRGGGEFDWESAVSAPVLALSKQFREKSYLLSVSQFLDAMFDDDPKGEKIERFFGNMAANFVPYSAAMRQFNPDDSLHEARDVVDRFRATVPGYSKDVPLKYDAWGDPVTAHSRNWFSSSDTGELVDREVQRLLTETGKSVTRVAPRINGVDLRDIEMSSGKNAYEEYAKLAGHLPKTKPLKEMVATVIQSKTYRKAPDGDSSTKGTKLYMLADLAADYRGKALDYLKRDPIVREALLKKQRDVIAAYRGGGDAKPQASEPSGLLGLINGALGGGEQ